MKRCPQCEFIYEDDQSLCDMDGVLLVLDSRTLPNLHALTTVPAKVQPRRNRAVPAFATLILVLVLGMVYYVSTRRQTVPTVEAPASVITTSNPASVANPTPEVQPSAESKEPPAVEAKPAPAKKPAAKTVSVSQPKPSPEPKKEESKVGSILKKTGRILKKPFKF
jgi:outer membrane biosynthesis protein TonB